LKKSAKEYFTKKTAEYAKVMNLSYSRIKITSAKQRFGSCSSDKNISFSYRLMLYPEAAREYVIVHELAHLILMNHSKAFYKIIENVLPDYKERRDCLKL
jgi:predicted metal-dependent hydrolase